MDSSIVPIETTYKKFDENTIEITDSQKFYKTKEQLEQDIIKLQGKIQDMKEKIIEVNAKLNLLA